MKRKVAAIILCLIMALSCISPVSVVQADNTKIKNIIYLIPDGGGMVPFYLADAMKQQGGWDRSVYPNSTVTPQEEMYLKKYLVGAITTHSANNSVTDSAAAGTALSSGYKTNNSYVGVDSTKKPRANILEAAQTIGKNVGLVSTYEWSNATPAAFSAHEPTRGNYPPISEQIVNQGIDVVLGSGFGAAKWGDISEAENRGYNIINTREDLQAVKPGDKIWGNLLSGAFPYDINLKAETPNLAEMTKAAITALDEGNEGFFLMVEGSKVDGGGHANSAIGMVSEFLAFDEACKVALKYAEGRKDTLVVAAPDHDTGGMNTPQDLTNALASLKKGEEPIDITWTGTGHTARNGGLFMYVPKGVKYPEGISGKDIGTNKAYEENVVDNTIIANYLADIMGLNLDDVTKKLFVDVTDMGEFSKELGVFSFNDYPISVAPNVSTAYVGNEAADLDGQVTVYINGRFYVPEYLLDIARGKVTYTKKDYSVPVVSFMDTYAPDVSNVSKMNGRITIKNIPKGRNISGKIKFTAPENFASLEPISINVEGATSKMYEFECPQFDVNSSMTFKYDIIADNGETWSFSYKFNGITYANYADTEIKIDGVIDEKIWEKGYVMVCDDASRLVDIEDWKGDRDLSGKFSILWDEEYFYMYAKVTDEDYCQNQIPSALYNGDSVQFGIYHDSEGLMAKKMAGSTFEEIGIAIKDDKPMMYRFKSQSGLTRAGEISQGDGFDIAYTKVGDDTIYELRFTWEKLLGFKFTPNQTSALGFSALINDNDGGGRRGYMEYGSGIGNGKDANKFIWMPLLDLSDTTDRIRLFVNDKIVKSDSMPVIVEGRTLVPVRAIFEALGADVAWDNDTKTVTSKMGDKTVSLKIGEKQISVNGETKEIDVPAQIINDRTLVPVRTVSESFGCKVEWNDKNRTIHIEDAKRTKELVKVTFENNSVSPSSGINFWGKLENDKNANGAHKYVNWSDISIPKPQSDEDFGSSLLKLDALSCNSVNGVYKGRINDIAAEIVNYTAGKTYKISMWVYLDDVAKNGDSAEIRITPYINKDADTHGKENYITVKKGEWTKVETEYTISEKEANATPGARVSFKTTESDAYPLVVYMDNLTFCEINK